MYNEEKSDNFPKFLCIFVVVAIIICTDLPKALKRDSIYNIDVLF